jgi:hypothetical protein
MLAGIARLGDLAGVVTSQARRFIDLQPAASHTGFSMSIATSSATRSSPGAIAVDCALAAVYVLWVST